MGEMRVLHGVYDVPVDKPSAKDPELFTSETMMSWWRLIRTQMRPVSK